MLSVDMGKVNVHDTIFYWKPEKWEIWKSPFFTWISN